MINKLLRSSHVPSFPEQGIGGFAVCCGLSVMVFDTTDFAFKQYDSFIEFGLRVGCKIFAAELAGGIASGAGEIIVIHCLVFTTLSACCQSHVVVEAGINKQTCCKFAATRLSQAIIGSD